MIWVDHSAASAFKDNVYAIWHNGSPAFMNRRTGPAGSWQTPVQVSGAETTGAAIGGDVKTNAMGDVFGFWPATGNQKVFVVKSTNGGVSYGTPVAIATTFDGFDIGVPSFNSRRALIYVSGGAYRTASKNLVYATWTDLTGEAGCTAPAQRAGIQRGFDLQDAHLVRAIHQRRRHLVGAGDDQSTRPRSTTSSTRGWWSTRRPARWASSTTTPWAIRAARRPTSGISPPSTTASPGRRRVKVTSAQTRRDGRAGRPGQPVRRLQRPVGHRRRVLPLLDRPPQQRREEIWTAKISDPACTAPGAPAIGTATATGPNQIQVTWGNGSPSSTAFNVYRAFGTCASPGTFTRIATGSGRLAVQRQHRLGRHHLRLPGHRPATPPATASPGRRAASRPRRPAPARCRRPSRGSPAPPTTGRVLRHHPRLGGRHAILRRTDHLQRLPFDHVRLHAGSGQPDRHRRHRHGLLRRLVERWSAARPTTTSCARSTARTAWRRPTPSSAAPRSPGRSRACLDETFEGAGGFDNPGWTHAAIAGAVDWAWSTAQSQTPTHSWFSASQTTVSDRVLVTPAFVPTASSLLSFWHTFAFERRAAPCFDGGTLEVSTNGGSTWTVLPDAAFTAGGFNGTVSTASRNPIGGKRAWCHGTIGAMTAGHRQPRAPSPARACKLRWHEGDDSSAEATGWFVDSRERLRTRAPARPTSSSTTASRAAT